MKALIVRSLLAAILIGPTISFVIEFTSLRGAKKYEPGISEEQFHQMGNMTVNQMEAILGKRTVRMTRWEWLRESVHYAYFWKHLAYNGLLQGSSVFVACMWVGWMEKRHARRLAITA